MEKSFCIEFLIQIFDRYMEERGDLDRIEDILIPIQIDESATIL